MKPVVIDTSAWIEWLMDTAFADRLKPHWPSLEALIVPTIVQHELAKWMRREASEMAMRDAIAYTMNGIVVPLDTRIALNAAELAAEHKLATADAIIYATALASGAELLTCDAHFKGLAQVRLIGKAD